MRGPYSDKLNTLKPKNYMKTKIKGFLAIVFALFMFSSMTTKAQCGKIANQTHYDFKLKVVMYTKTDTGCDLVCNSFGAALPPGASIPIPCGNCQKICNIEVYIIAINGVATSPIPMADYYNGYQPLPANRCGAVKFGYNAGGYFEMLP